jgi:hypothetical protein
MDPIAVADVFRSNLFGTTSLTNAVNEIPYVPQRLMELDVFDVQGIPTTTAFIEKKGEALVLVPSTPRGAPGTSVSIDRREAIPFQAAHLQLEDRIYADEIQNVRAFGSGNQLEGVQQVRDQRLTKMSRSIDLTLEYHRLGAIQGLVLDADGTTVLEDLFDKFGISEPDDIGLELDAAWTIADGGVVRKALAGVTRGIDDDLGGFTPTGYHAFAGDDFFDALVGHPEVVDTYRASAAAAELRGDPRRTFQYGNITFENYRGQGAVKIADDEARVIPLGVPELFVQLFSPADIMSAVNTMGQVKYALAVPDPSGKDKFIEMEVQSNPITYCTRPRVLRRLLLGEAT